VDNVLHAAGNGETSAPPVVLNYLASDSDGDSSTDGALSIIFNDDAPAAIAPKALTTVTNAAGQTGSQFLDVDNDVDNNFGADGGAVVFTAASITALESQNLTSGLAPLSYAISADGSVLTATKSGDGTLVFTITLDPLSAEDQYVINLTQPLDSKSTIDFNDGGYNFVGGNGSWAGFTQPGTTGSRDLLLTPQENDLNAGTVNTNANEGGISAGNSVGAGEVFRVDFVIDLTGSPSSGADYAVPANQNHTFSGHYTVNGASALFTKITGSSSVKIEAFDDYNGNNLVNDGTQDPITSIGISYNGETKVVTTSGNVTVGGHVFLVTFTGGYATVAGVVENTRLAGFTDDGFSSIEFGYAGGNTFKIGDFGATTISNDPVNFTVPVVTVDGDGDVANSLTDISITLQPVSMASALSSASSAMLLSTVEGSVSNDNLATNPIGGTNSQRSGMDQRGAQMATISAMAVAVAMPESLVASPLEQSGMDMTGLDNSESFVTSTVSLSLADQPEQLMAADDAFFGSQDAGLSARIDSASDLAGQDVGKFEGFDHVSIYDQIDLTSQTSEPAFSFGANAQTAAIAAPSVEGSMMMDALLTLGQGSAAEAGNGAAQASTVTTQEMPDLQEAFLDMVSDQAVEAIIDHFAADGFDAGQGTPASGPAGTFDVGILNMGVAQSHGIFGMQGVVDTAAEDMSMLTATA
ncbi:hypothetical protein GRI44_08345, partial [Altererythrobacter confluentis]|nr:hypothetical protein [Allopontixanthobacter confluentis]